MSGKLIENEHEAIEALKLINLSRVHPFYTWEEMLEVRDMAIQALKEVQQYREIGTVEECRAAVEKQKAKRIKHIHQEFEEHKWARMENGEIDDMAFQYENHNGPICERCGYYFCMLCKPDGWDKEKCVTDDYICPTCGANVGENDIYCQKCGQKLEREE